MENLTVNYEQIEQELQELRNHFSSADLVLRDLQDIQIEFEHIAEIYKKLKEDVKKYESEFSRFNLESNGLIKLFQQSQERFEQHFTKLRDANQIKLDGLKSQLLEYQNSLSIHNSDIQVLQSSMRLVEKSCHDIDQQTSATQQACRDLKKQIIIMRYALIFLVVFLLLLVAWVGRN